jgi:hypothetical protein
MRRLLAMLLCALLAGLPALAQSATTQSQSSPQQNTTPANPNAPVARPNSTPSQSADSRDQQQDPNIPVLKRRTPAQRAEQSDEPPVEQAPQSGNGPVLQTRQPSPNTIPMARTVPVNTQFHATLDRALSTKYTHSGDPFTVTLTEPLRNQQGETLIPAGTRINGIVQTSDSGKIFASMRGKGKLELRFQEVELANGQKVPIQATLLGVVEKKGSGAKTTDEGQVTGGGPSGKTTAKDVGIGAGVGTLAGLIMGSALKGMAIGAIAGGGYVLANAGKDVEIPENTTLNVRLDQLLTVLQ